MSIQTVSEQLFERLCSAQGVKCVRISEGRDKSADYEVSLGSTTLIVEVKQLDPSAADKELESLWGQKNSPGAIAPSIRVQHLLADAYPQIKTSSCGLKPTMVVIYNNSGAWNWIDSFTVSKAMFGSFGIKLGLDNEEKIAIIGQKYVGKRKVTKSSFRALSVVAAIKDSASGVQHLDAYHNPFAMVPISPNVLSQLATAHYMHPNPHECGIVSWEPQIIET